MSQAYNLGKFANTLNTSGQIDPTTGLVNQFPTTNLPTIPINKGGTNLTTVGANGTILGTDGSAYTYGSASGALTWDTVKTSSFTASAGYGYLVNTTSSSITVTLPASPSIGQTVVIVDYAGTFATNNVTVDPNGSKINTGSSKLLQTNREGITFVYIDSTQGWLAQSNVYAGNPPFVNAPTIITYLVVAGGGGGGGYMGGGGGAGGLLSGSFSATLSNVYTITIGGGGAGGIGYPLGSGGTNAINGSNSVLSGSGLSTITSIGGGRGGNYGENAGSAGASGGSGGGAGGGSTGVSPAGGSGTSGQGYAGGSGIGSPSYGGGGGGGAGGIGNSGTSSTGGNGGVGSTSSITGSSVYYAGGGGAGAYQLSAGSGGLGGGANGSYTGNGNAGTANLGGGGGGGGNNDSLKTGGAGGSGVVILSIPTAQYTGTTTGSPTVTTSGSNTILKYTASGTYTA